MDDRALVPRTSVRLVLSAVRVQCGCAEKMTAQKMAEGRIGSRRENGVEMRGTGMRRVPLRGYLSACSLKLVMA